MRYGKCICASAPLLLACSADGARTTLFVERDSAGVAIIENSRAALADLPRWTVTDTPLLSIGVAAGDPAYELHRIQDVNVTSAGEILILNAGSEEVRVYDAAGYFARSIGRRGSGPGEFESAFWILVLGGDSVLVYDGLAQRFSIFTDTGLLARDVSVIQHNIRFRKTAGLLQGNAVLIPYGPFPWENVGGLRRDTVHLRKFTTTGDELAEIGSFPGEEYFWLRETTATGAGELLAFGRSLQIAAGDSLVFAGTTDSYQIGMYTHDGELRRIVRLDIEPVPVTAPLIAAWKRSRLERYVDAASRVRFGRVHDAMPFPATMPSFSRLATDTDHNLWVRNYPTHPDSGADWLVFDRQGRLQASICLPDHLSERVIQSDRIIGTWTDDDGVESVRIYGIRRDS